MKNQITLGQAIGFAITLLLTFGAAHVSTQNRIAVLEEKVIEHTNELKRVDDLNDKLIEVQSDVKLIIYKVDQLKESDRRGH